MEPYKYTIEAIRVEALRLACGEDYATSEDTVEAASQYAEFIQNGTIPLNPKKTGTNNEQE